MSPTINLNPVDLGQIELLVAQGFYANRAEFIRLAIHDELAKRVDVVREATTHRSMVIGAVFHDRHSLEELQKAGKRLSLRVVGLLVIRDDVTPELAREVIESVTVHGVFKARAAVQEALSDRMVG